MFALIVGSGLGSLRMIQGLGSTLDSAVEVTAKKMQLAENLQSAFRQVRLACTLAEISLINSTILGESKLGGRDQPGCGGCHTQDNVRSLEANIETAFQAAGRAATALGRLASDPRRRRRSNACSAGSPNGRRSTANTCVWRECTIFRRRTKSCWKGFTRWSARWRRRRGRCGTSNCDRWRRRRPERRWRCGRPCGARGA